MKGGTTRLFSYKITHDTGFAPNPFCGFLTLATCKPQIRRSKVSGDWIAGFTSQGLCGDAVGDERLVFLMQVAEKLTFSDYFQDQRFQTKIPNLSSDIGVHLSGDNIYRPITPNPQSPSDFEQLPNPNHWDGEAGCGGSESQQHDLNGWFVLIAERFVYFGREALYIPPEIRPEVPRGQSAQGSRTYDSERAERFFSYALNEAAGKQVVGPPHTWPENDESWSWHSEDHS